MSVRVPLDPKKFGDVLGAMLGLNKVIESAGLDQKLLYLVELRVSQINGCGFCIDMHTKDARLNGETEQRLYLLDAWREAPMYSERERAALAWAEAVTKLEKGHVPDEVYAQAREHFDEQQLMKLTLAGRGDQRLEPVLHFVQRDAGHVQGREPAQGGCSSGRVGRASARLFFPWRPGSFNVRPHEKNSWRPVRTGARAGGSRARDRCGGGRTCGQDHGRRAGRRPSLPTGARSIPRTRCTWSSRAAAW